MQCAQNLIIWFRWCLWYGRRSPNFRNSFLFDRVCIVLVGNFSSLYIYWKRYVKNKNINNNQHSSFFYYKSGKMYCRKWFAHYSRVELPHKKGAEFCIAKLEAFDFLQRFLKKNPFKWIFASPKLHYNLDQKKSRIFSSNFYFSKNSRKNPLKILKLKMKTENFEKKSSIFWLTL